VSIWRGRLLLQTLARMGRPLHESRVLLGHRVHLRDGPVHLLDAAARQQHGAGGTRHHAAQHQRHDPRARRHVAVPHLQQLRIRLFFLGRFEQFDVIVLHFVEVIQVFCNDLVIFIHFRLFGGNDVLQFTRTNTRNLRFDVFDDANSGHPVRRQFHRRVINLC